METGRRLFVNRIGHQRRPEKRNPIRAWCAYPTQFRFPLAFSDSTRSNQSFRLTCCCSRPIGNFERWRRTRASTSFQRVNYDEHAPERGNVFATRSAGNFRMACAILVAVVTYLRFVSASIVSVRQQRCCCCCKRYARLGLTMATNSINPLAWAVIWHQLFQSR